MPKQIPDEVRMKAMELFLEGKSAPTISRTLKELFDQEVKPSTIYSWDRQFRWKDSKVEARTAAVDQIKETETQRYARIQQEHLTEYGELRTKASLELKGHMFDKAFDAAKALDLGIKGERNVMEGMINLQFVQDIMSVLVEEIQDPDILQRIAIKLKTLIQTQEDDG